MVTISFNNLVTVFYVSMFAQTNIHKITEYIIICLSVTVLVFAQLISTDASTLSTYFYNRVTSLIYSYSCRNQRLNEVYQVHNRQKANLINDVSVESAVVAAVLLHIPNHCHICIFSGHNTLSSSSTSFSNCQALDEPIWISPLPQITGLGCDQYILENQIRFKDD